MRRRIASRVIPGQDVCLFCAFRPVFGVAATTARPRHAVREYTNTRVTSSPAGTSAAQRQDEDENESPMLKANSSLANSFPSQRPVRSHPVSQPQKQADRESDQQSRRDQTPTNRLSAQRNKQDGPTFRNNFDAFSRNSNGVGPRRYQENRNDKFSKHFDTRYQNKQSPSDDPFASSSERPRSSFRRAFPSQDSAALTDQKNSTTEALSGRSHRDLRSPRQSQNSMYPQQPSRDIPNGVSNFRRVAVTGQVEYTPAVARQPTSNESDDLTPEQNGGAIADSSELPAGTSFSTEEELKNAYHRRGHRDDKKKSRSARYEDEEQDGESSGVSAFMPGQPTPPSRSGVRATQFDFAMAEAEAALYGDGGRRKKKNKDRKTQEVVQSKPTVRISEFMSVGQLAAALNVRLDPFIQRLEEEGFEGARYDNILDAQTSSMLADLYGYESTMAEEAQGVDLVARAPPEDLTILPPRPPIVTIMGHVDHGKTTILDYLRKSSVVATEHGGITQHIGAFSVTMPGTNRQITFLDTPGHAAFLEMRRRGANVTDIVVLVVAADDSVKPQTIEAIKHAIDAKVQIIVAINKIDKEDADIERVKQDLTRHEIVVEDYGGDFQSIPVSGKTGQGMAELEEAIITLADVYDFRAESDGLAEGTIIESKVTSAGRVATVLVRRGTLRPGDFIVAGTTWARVRTLRNDTGAVVTEAPPGTPVQVDGWRGEDPTAGLEVLQAENEDRAKDAVDYRIEKRESDRASADMAAINESRNEEADARARVLAWEAEQEWARKTYSRRPKDNAGWVEPETASGPKQVHFVVKADVAGSVEAVVAAVTAVGNNEISANVIHSGTGQVTESDIRMLATTGETGYAISFNQPVDGMMYRLAEASGLQILDHNIIYKVTDTVKEKLAEQLPPIITQKVLGEAEIGKIFEVTIKKTKVKIAGCKITNGTISRANKIRVQRDGAVVYTGTLHSLKNVKKDVTEMRKGTECGMGFEEWDDFQEGDQIQCFEEHEEKRTLY